ncbi:hypothetical protein VTK73DRAFT_9439 [Phialemonium thermophilum]|uniref:asparagine--tRNA ligase n=1 Tax=Phialemonium thermophilum TaxID=223376 RepID=A0ABR3XK83_9PEZI
MQATCHTLRRACVLNPAHPHLRRSLSQLASAPVGRLLEWKPQEEVKDVVVHGYVRSVRHMKSQTFISLGDGSSLVPLQALVPSDLSESLTVGAAVQLKGSWVSSPAAGQSHELRVEEVDILGPSDAKTFPIQKKYQTAEYLRTLPHLRSRTPFNALLLRLRSEAIASLTQFFTSRQFTQTHPPILTSSDCEGAGEVFTVSPVDEQDPSDAEEGNGFFFRSPKYLTVSTQLHLEALAQSVGNVWTLSPTFRAERSDTSRHLSEFYMLEAEMSFVKDLDVIMDLAEEMLRHLSSSLFDARVGREIFSRPSHVGQDLESVDKIRQRWEGLMATEWPRLTYSEAIDLLVSRADMFDHKPRWGLGLQAEHEKYVAQHIGNGKPVFVTHYPQDIKAFYMRQTVRTVGPEDGKQRMGPTVECFDLLVPDMCEIAGGSMREHQLPKLLEAMRSRNMATPELPGAASGAATGPDVSQGGAGVLDWYIDLRRWGCPPHGGFGLGFDRLLGYLSGVQSIRDVVSFPRWFGRCDC